MPVEMESVDRESMDLLGDALAKALDVFPASPFLQKASAFYQEAIAYLPAPEEGQPEPRCYLAPKATLELLSVHIEMAYKRNEKSPELQLLLKEGGMLPYPASSQSRGGDTTPYAGRR